MRRILIALCALTMLSGCGGGVDASLLAAAVKNTEEAGGAEIAMQMTMESPGGETVVLTGSGVEDALGRRADVTMTVPEAGEMRAIADGFTLYMGMDELESQFGKRWVKIDLMRAWKELGLELDGLAQVGQGASQQLGLLKTVSDGLTDHGRETVVGVEATHYSATVDLRRYPEVVPEAQREAVRQSMDRLIELAGQSEIPVDVWVDDSQRVRRIESEESMGDGVSGKMVVEYVRFGVPVDIEAPDDDDVFDATSLSVREAQQEHGW